MRLIDRLSRGIRIFRISADMRGIERELTGIREALFVICREGFNVELDPRRPTKIPADAKTAYFEEGGESDIRKVAAIMEEAGYEIPEAQLEPLGAVLPLDEPPPFPSFLYRDSEEDEDKEDSDDSDSDGIPTARRNRTPAGTAGPVRRTDDVDHEEPQHS